MKVTVLIETLPAAFEMDEILHALRRRIAGLNCGRWDYIFSYLKTFRAHRDKVLPERGQVTMTQPFLKAYSRTAGPDLPPPRRARDGRHGGADPDRRRRRGQRSARWRACAPTSCAKSAPATTAPGSRIRR